MTLRQPLSLLVLVLTALLVLTVDDHRYSSYHLFCVSLSNHQLPNSPYSWMQQEQQR